MAMIGKKLASFAVMLAAMSGISQVQHVGNHSILRATPRINNTGEIKYTSPIFIPRYGRTVASAKREAKKRNNIRKHPKAA
jgi:hypothetical protein